MAAPSISIARLLTLGISVAWQEAVHVARAASAEAEATSRRLTLVGCTIATDGQVRVGDHETDRIGPPLSELQLLSALLQGQKAPPELKTILATADDPLSGFPSEHDAGPQALGLEWFVGSDPSVEIGRLAKRAIDAERGVAPPLPPRKAPIHPLGTDYEPALPPWAKPPIRATAPTVVPAPSAADGATLHGEIRAPLSPATIAPKRGTASTPPLNPAGPAPPALESFPTGTPDPTPAPNPGVPVRRHSGGSKAVAADPVPPATLAVAGTSGPIAGPLSSSAKVAATQLAAPLGARAAAGIDSARFELQRLRWQIADLRSHVGTQPRLQVVAVSMALLAGGLFAWAWMASTGPLLSSRLLTGTLSLAPSIQPDTPEYGTEAAEAAVAGPLAPGTRSRPEAERRDAGASVRAVGASGDSPVVYVPPDGPPVVVAPTPAIDASLRATAPAPSGGRGPAGSNTSAPAVSITSGGAPAPLRARESRIYSSEDVDVAPPTWKRPQLPSEPRPDSEVTDAYVELVVDERGEVEQVKLRSSDPSLNDRMIVAAAKAWQFQPAMKDGQPVKYVLRLPVTR